jgi:hypothetical protein
VVGWAVKKLSKDGFMASKDAVGLGLGGGLDNAFHINIL